MATFNTFSDILPDPVFRITEAGSLDTVNGNAGPGFASMKLRSVDDAQVTRTISGRGVHRTSGAHHWEVDINYNPMMRYQFDPVDTFLQIRGRMNPFYVVLPQNSRPKMTSFFQFNQVNTVIAQGYHNAGTPTMLIAAGVSIVGDPMVSDLINIYDPTNVNHRKTYKIVRVETPSLYQEGSDPLASNQRRIWIHPPLERNVSANSQVIFINPRIRVIPKSDTQEYDLSTDNLYSFSLSLEEIQA